MDLSAQGNPALEKAPVYFKKRFTADSDQQTVFGNAGLLSWDYRSFETKCAGADNPTSPEHEPLTALRSNESQELNRLPNYERWNDKVLYSKKAVLQATL